MCIALFTLFTMRTRVALSTSFTLFTWLYVDNITYKFGEKKHILTKGKLAPSNMPLGVFPEDHCPSFWIDPLQNNININITNKAGVIEEMVLKDFPIRKWFSLCVIIMNSSCDIYMNGKLSLSKPLSAIPKLNNGNLIVNNNGGFEGNLAGLS